MGLLSKAKKIVKKAVKGAVKVAKAVGPAIIAGPDKAISTLTLAAMQQRARTPQITVQAPGAPTIVMPEQQYQGFFPMWGESLDEAEARAKRERETLAGMAGGVAAGTAAGKVQTITKSQRARMAKVISIERAREARIAKAVKLPPRLPPGVRAGVPGLLWTAADVIKRLHRAGLLGMRQARPKVRAKQPAMVGRVRIISGRREAAALRKLPPPSLPQMMPKGQVPTTRPKATPRPTPKQSAARARVPQPKIPQPAAPAIIRPDVEAVRRTTPMPNLGGATKPQPRTLPAQIPWGRVLDVVGQAYLAHAMSQRPSRITVTPPAPNPGIQVFGQPGAVVFGSGLTAQMSTALGSLPRGSLAVQASEGIVPRASLNACRCPSGQTGRERQKRKRKKQKHCW